MRQKGFATIFGLCLVLVIAIIARGIQEAENYHAREVLNFYLEEQLQNAAESGIYKAAEIAREDKDHSILPMADTFVASKKKILTDSKTFEHGDKKIDIEIEVWGNRGKIYERKSDGILTSEASGVYLMARASTPAKFFDGTSYRRAYAYILDAEPERIHFMELPLAGS